MKKFKAILALLLAMALLVTLCAACSSGGGEAQSPAGDNDAQQGGAPAGNNGDSTPADDGEITNIKFYLIDMYGVDTYDTTIEDAITEKEIGVHVDVEFYGMGDYNANLSMAISAGEEVDVACIWVLEPCSVTTMYGSNQLTEISSYLDEYAPDLKALVSDYLGAYEINGGLYGIPTYRNFSTSVYLTVRKDLLEQVGVSVDDYYNMTTFSELEELMSKVVSETGVFGLGNSIIQNAAGIYYTGDNFKTDLDIYDLLGDSLYVVHTDDSGKVTATFENESYIYSAKKMADWKDKGLIWPESLTNDEHVDNIMKQGLIFASVQPCEIGAETAKSATTGYDVACLTMGDCVVMTSDVNKFGVGIPITSEEPEAAMKFLNLIYTSKDLMNIIDWGIEGADWVTTESGEADYVGGDKSTARYHNPDFIFGNYFLVEPWIGDGADFRDVAKQVNDAAPKSQYLGFVMDTTGMDNVIAGITAVKDEFKDILYGYYTDEHYDAMVKKMQAAGVQDYLDEIQKQLDAFLAQ